MTSRPLLTIAQVVDQFDLSRATVRRGIESGRFGGSHKDQQGRWLVPVESLVAVGIKPRKTWLEGPTNRVATELAHERIHEHTRGQKPTENGLATELAHRETELAHSTSRIAQLEAQLESEKRLREAAERNSEDLRTALRMLEAGTDTQNVSSRSTPHRDQRRRWWQIR